MVTAVLSLREDYWEEYELEDQDISYLYDYLLENETPLTSEELMPILVEQRISREKVELEKKRLDGNDVYYPKDQYEVGKKLVFPAFEWQKGEVTGSRSGENPATGQFGVILVEFEKPIGLKFMEFAEYIEGLLGTTVDILTPAGIESIRIDQVARNIKENIIYV